MISYKNPFFIILIFTTLLSACEQSSPELKKSNPTTEINQTQPVPTVQISATKESTDQDQHYLSFGFNTQRQALAYALGYDKSDAVMSYIEELKLYDIILDTTIAAQGIADKKSNTEHDQFANSKLPLSELKSLIYGLEAEVRQKQQALAQSESRRNIVIARDYLTANAKKDGVTQLQSGLQFEIVKQGNGAKPSHYDRIKVKYSAQLIDGTPVDLANGHGENWVEMSHMIAGISEALSNMSVGEKWQVTIPPDLAYGASRHGKIPANSVLIYQLELIDIKP